MAETSGQFDLYGQPYVHDPENAERAHRGAALCLAAIDTRHGEDVPLDPDDPIRDRALRRARTERRRAA
jgi:hypothetical protein